MHTTTSTHSSGFDDVDRSARAGALGREMQIVGDDPLTQRYLVVTLDALGLHAGSSLADVGCGTAPDLANLCSRIGGRGEVHLVDPSVAFLTEARARLAQLPPEGLPNIQFHQASAAILPFVEASLDAVRFVRVFQHIEDARSAVAESSRVLKPGGRFLAIDPVWSTLALSGADQEVAQLVASSASFRMKNWLIAPKLPALLAAHGIISDSIEVVTRTIRSFEEARRFYSLDERISNLVDRGNITSQRGDEWLTQCTRDSSSGHFLCSLSLWMIGGRKTEPDYRASAR